MAHKSFICAVLVDIGACCWKEFNISCLIWYKMIKKYIYYCIFLAARQNSDSLFLKENVEYNLASSLGFNDFLLSS